MDSDRTFILIMHKLYYGHLTLFFGGKHIYKEEFIDKKQTCSKYILVLTILRNYLHSYTWEWYSYSQILKVMHCDYCKVLYSYLRKRRVLVLVHTTRDTPRVLVWQCTPTTSLLKSKESFNFVEHIIMLAKIMQ